MEEARAFSIRLGLLAAPGSFPPNASRKAYANRAGTWLEGLSVGDRAASSMVDRPRAGRIRVRFSRQGAANRALSCGSFICEKGIATSTDQKSLPPNVATSALACQLLSWANASYTEPWTLTVNW